MNTMVLKKYLHIEKIKEIHHIVFNLQSNMSGTINTEKAIRWLHIRFIPTFVWNYSILVLKETFEI